MTDRWRPDGQFHAVRDALVFVAVFERIGYIVTVLISFN